MLYDTIQFNPIRYHTIHYNSTQSNPIHSTGRGNHNHTLYILILFKYNIYREIIERNHCCMRHSKGEPSPIECVIFEGLQYRLLVFGLQEGIFSVD